MEYNVVLQAFNPQGNIRTWKYSDIKSYLINENHIYKDNDWKIHKVWVNGEELENIPDGEIGINYFRDVSDFKIFCRTKLDRKEIEMPIPKDILRKFLLNECNDKRNRVYLAIQDGNSIDSFYNNGGCGKCEYRPGYIEGCDFFGKKVTITWINNDADMCVGAITRTQILNEIKVLVNEGIYCNIQNKIKPKTVFIDDGEQLPGQLSISDWLTV